MEIFELRRLELERVNCNAKLHVPVVTLSTQDNVKLLEQLKSGCKKTINWNKYQLKVLIEV